MTQTRQSLNLQYWGPVHDMCKGTALEGREWECVKHEQLLLADRHPCFQSSISGQYELAVAVVENEAVFWQAALYNIKTKQLMNWEILIPEHVQWYEWTWIKPEPLRTFLLNGVELPCPVKSHEKRCNFIRLMGSDMGFRTQADYEKVSYAILRILIEARDK